MIIFAATGPSSAQQDTVRSPADAPGVVVENVTPGFAFASAGFQAGDVLRAWRRGDEDGGVLSTLLDLLAVELEEMPRGTVELSGEHGGTAITLTLPPEPWGARLRPALRGAHEVAYRQGRARLDADDLPGAIREWGKLLLADGVSPDPFFPVWIRLRLAAAWAKTPPPGPERSYHFYEEALREAAMLGDPRAPAAVWEDRAGAAKQRNDWEEVRQAYLEAAQLRRQRGQRSLSLAFDYQQAAGAAYYSGDADAAVVYAQKDSEICAELVPGTRRHGSALNNLGVILDETGDLVKAEAVYQQALEIFSRAGAGGLYEAALGNNLGALALARGRFAEAEEYFSRAYEVLGPDHPRAVLPLTNLAALALERWELDLAEERFQEVIALHKKLDPKGFPGSFEEATINYNLALVAQRQAQKKKALIARSRGDEKQKLVAQRRENLKRAENLYEKVRAVRQKQQKAGDADIEAHARLAIVLHSLGTLRAHSGDPRGAEKYYRLAIDARPSKKSSHLVTADSLFALGPLLREQGKIEEAKKLLEEALAIYQRLAPGSWTEALTLNELGSLHAEMGEHGAALEFFERSVQALEVQTDLWGGGEETRANLLADHSDLYRTLIEALRGQHKDEEAFIVLERYRGRIFLSILAQQDLTLDRDLPGHPELEQKRRRLTVSYERKLAELADLRSDDQEAIGRIRADLDKLLIERAAVIQKIRDLSPRLATLKYPIPLDFGAIRKVLEPGTVMLSYSVGETTSDVFVVAPGRPLRVVTLPIGDAELRRKVGWLRDLIRSHRDHPGYRDDPSSGLVVLSRELFESLLDPIYESIAAANRLLIIPDAALHNLPFDALIIGGRHEESGRYLVEWKPLSTVLSGTVYANLTAERGRAAADTAVAGPQLVAFGDPAYPEPPASEKVEVRSITDALINGFNRLPETRREVEGIAALFGESAVIHLGAAATEENAKAIGRGPRYLHFACHGVFDQLTPLNSALVLTLPEPAAGGRENGLLQAWEILEQVRLNATLVTLSACETGRGEDMGGEGLLGLARAFQYAGARSLLVSRWKVRDASTADLMLRVYRYLKAGKSKDDALRTAQIDLINGPEGTASPYHWAAFQLIGDWK